MHEKQTIIASPESKFGSEQIELIDTIVNDIYTNPTLGFAPESGRLSRAYTDKLGTVITSDFEAVLHDTGYYPGEDDLEELTEGIYACVKFALLAPGHLMSQRRKDVSGDNKYSRQLCEFNQALRDVVRTNPTITQESLQNIYTSMFTWGGIDQSFMQPSLELYDSVTRGVRSEIVFDQIARTESFSKNGITPREASIDEDLAGNDIILNVSQRSNTGEYRTTEFGIDLKASRTKVPINGGKYGRHLSDNFGVDRGKVILYFPVTNAEVGNAFLLPEAEAEKRADALIPEVFLMAEAIRDDRSNRELARNRHLGKDALERRAM